MRQFAERARLLDIAIDQQVIERLFNALLIDKVDLGMLPLNVLNTFDLIWRIMCIKLDYEIESSVYIYFLRITRETGLVNYGLQKRSNLTLLK